MGGLPLYPYRMANVTTGHDSALGSTTYKELFVDLFKDVTADEPAEAVAIMQGMLAAVETLLLHHVNSAKQFEELRERILKTYSVSDVRQQ